MKNTRLAIAIILFASLPVLGFIALFNQEGAIGMDTSEPNVQQAGAHTEALSSSKHQTEWNNLDAFDEVELADPHTLLIVQGEQSSKPKLTAEGPTKALEQMTVEVADNELRIKKKDDGLFDWQDMDEAITYTLTLPADAQLSALAHSGSGSIRSAAKWEWKDVALSLSGSGDIALNLTADAVAAKLAGSGDIELALSAQNIEGDIAGSGKLVLSGQVDKTQLNIAGSGDVEGPDFTTRKLQANLAGSGNVEMTVTEDLDASIMGSGDIRYGGQPSRVEVKALGSGEATPKAAPASKKEPEQPEA